MIAGTMVAVGDIQAGFVCVHVSNGHSETDGWLPADQVQIALLPSPPPSITWVGTWHFQNNEIRLQVRGDSLHGAGTAIWRGLYTAHTGNFEADAIPNDSRLEFTEGLAPGECRLSLTLMEDMLAVVDNQACGGMNVTFSGLYVRIK